MTSDQHVSGTDRVVEVSNKDEYKGYDIYVNIQGDEPMIRPSDINDLVDKTKKYTCLFSSTYPNTQLCLFESKELPAI